MKALSACVLAPDVQHEHGRDEHQGAHQDWEWTHFDARRVISVEPPHATGGCCAAPGCGGGGLSLPDSGTSCPATTPRGS